MCLIIWTTLLHSDIKGLLIESPSGETACTKNNNVDSIVLSVTINRILSVPMVSC